MKRYRNLLFIIIAFFVGVFATLSTGLVLAHGGNTNLIHGCIRNNGLLAGFIRIVGANTNCNNNETALDWTKEAGNNGLPFTCPSCDFKSFGSRFQGKNLTNSFLPNATFSGENISQTNFSSAELRNTDFRSSTLTGANFTNSSGGFILDDADATGANFSNLNPNNSGYGILARRVVLQNANFTNANLRGVDFTGATGMNTATLTGVIWSNTVCPDSTNSDNNGNTCVGHLTP